MPSLSKQAVILVLLAGGCTTDGCAAEDYVASDCSIEPRPATKERPLPDLRRAQRQAMARQDYRLALELAEGIKCRELHHRLIKARATPHLLVGPQLLPLTKPPLDVRGANNTPVWPAPDADLCVAPPQRTSGTPLSSRLDLGASGSAIPAHYLRREHLGAGIFALYQDQGQLFRFLVNHQGVRALPPLALTELTPLIIAARDELEHGDLDGRRLFQLLNSLYIMLVSPAQELLEEVRDLLIIPHGLTRFLPFHALNRGSAKTPHFWVQDLDIHYAPCLALAGKRPSPIYWAEVIAPLYGRRINISRTALPGAREEVQLLAKKYRINARHAFIGASPRRFELALRRPLSLVHFSGHGLAELTPESPPELLFPRGERSVTLESATKQPARAEVVVLASCTTAYAARWRGEHQGRVEVNLAEALLAAGVKAVVAASWTVKDRQSARMMKTFYTSLSGMRGEGVAKALNLAYRRAINQLRPPHPRFWAFYAAYGGAAGTAKLTTLPSPIGQRVFKCPVN